MLDFLKDLDVVKTSKNSGDLYKKEIFEGVKSESNARKQLRKTMQEFIKLKKIDEKVVKDFNYFYKKAYLTNDYSVESITNNDTKFYTMEEVKNFLDKVKKIAKYDTL